MKFSEIPSNTPEKTAFEKVGEMILEKIKNARSFDDVRAILNQEVVAVEAYNTAGTTVEFRMKSSKLQDIRDTAYNTEMLIQACAIGKPWDEIEEVNLCNAPVPPEIVEKIKEIYHNRDSEG